MRQVLESCIQQWLVDEGSSVEYAEELEGSWAVRMRQETRDATTVWFAVGERSLRIEAYVMPLPEQSGSAYFQALRRNEGMWRVFFALDNEGGLLLRGRLPEAQVTPLELDLVLGEIYDTVEVSFRPLLRVSFPGTRKIDLETCEHTRVDKPCGKPLFLWVTPDSGQNMPPGRVSA